MEGTPWGESAVASPTNGCISSSPFGCLRGPFGDHTLCAMMNDLRICARLAWPQTGHTLPVTSGNVLPRFTGGQVVAGSNPVSPTRSEAVSGIRKQPLFCSYPNRNTQTSRGAVFATNRQNDDTGFNRGTQASRCETRSVWTSSSISTREIHRTVTR